VELGTFDAPLMILCGMAAFRKICSFHSALQRHGSTGDVCSSFLERGRTSIGIHFIGRFGDEATLFRLASQLEKARPWQQRRPPISA